MMTKKIVLVDDDPVIRLLIKDYLTALNYQVAALESGIQCLENLTKALPDVLFLDFQMPVMTGLEVLRNIRGNTHMQALPVIMLSANSDTQKFIEAHQLHADLYIVKPFEMRQLQEAIEKLTSN